MCFPRVAIVTHNSLEAMPIVYKISRSQDMTVFTVTGQITFSAFTDSLREYGKDGPTLLELYDLRELTGERLSQADIDRLVEHLNKFASYRPNNSKTAVVVDEDIDFGICKAIALLTLIDGCVPYQINVFRVMDEAIRWLDLETHADAPNGATLNFLDGNDQ